MHHRILGTQQVSMPHGPAHDPTQNIATPFVGRHHTIGNQKRRRAQVIRHDAMMYVAVAVRIGRGRVRRGLDQGAHRVGVIIVVLALQQRANPLKPHTGVDRLHVERPHRTILELLVLHENDIPDLNEPVAVLLRRARRTTPDMVAVIIEDFGARPARPRGTHLPEIVRRRDANDPIFRHADLFPDFKGFIVGVIDGRQKTTFVDPKVIREQIPGVWDGFILEVVAKGEIAEHLKESVMPRRVANIVQVVVLATCPHALLAGCRTRIVTMLNAGEQILELNHARVGEHQRRIIPRHQRRALNSSMSVAFKIAEERRADVIQAGHISHTPRQAGDRYTAASGA